jgi:colanic acid/amylovoran biosynthesis glycosyltransferase
MLTNRDETARMGYAGRDFALESFNLQKQSVKLEDHLLRIAGEA